MKKLMAPILGGLLAAAVLPAPPVSAAGPGAPAASGTFTVGKDSYTFADAVAFRTTKLNLYPGERVTVVVLTADPIDRPKVAAAVAESGNWTGVPHSPRFILRFDDKGKLLESMFQAGGRNIGVLKLGDVAAQTTPEGGRFSGRLTLSKPADFFGDPYTFELAFGAEVVAGR